MSEAPYNPVAPALANAVRDAIGVRPYELPMSNDRICGSAPANRARPTRAGRPEPGRPEPGWPPD